jgi:hypothetical protein
LQRMEGVALARISSSKTPPAPVAARPAKTKADGRAIAASAAEQSRPQARRWAAALLVLGVIALLAWGTQAVWRKAAPIVAGRDRYLLPAEAITVTPTPAWIVANVREQVILKSGLDGRLSILDPGFFNAVNDAFSLHPWVFSVNHIEKKFPPAVHVDVCYRRPMAAIEVPYGNTHQLLPVDWYGIHLPEEDVPLIRLESLPRIRGIVGRPPVGQRWEDPRVDGAVELATLLVDVWEPMHLREISPSARPEIQGTRQFFVYEIVTRGGTRIQWGAAPRAQAPGEAEFVVKLERLRRCVEQYGPLDSVKSPGAVNVRGELKVEPRMVKKPKADGDAETVVK